MITCLSWIRKGTAKEIPLITDLSDEEEGREEEKEKKEEEEKEGEERENSDDEERLFHSPIVLTPSIVPFLFLFHIPTIFSNLTYFPVFV